MSVYIGYRVGLFYILLVLSCLYSLLQCNLFWELCADVYARICVCVVCVCVCIDQMAACRNHFSPPSIWVLKTELNLGHQACQQKPLIRSSPALVVFSFV